LVSVLHTHNIDPVGIFADDQVAVLNRVAAAQSIELPKSVESGER
jgi:hypothetical protein